MPTRYIRNELGAVHSVDEDHFVTYLHDQTRSGRLVLKAGFEEIDEAAARAANPQLFGHPDREIVRGMTSAEVKEARERRAFEKELEAELAATTVAEDVAEEPAEDDESAPKRRR